MIVGITTLGSGSHCLEQVFEVFDALLGPLLGGQSRSEAFQFGPHLDGVDELALGRFADP
jgi:hypothetical protein